MTDYRERRGAHRPQITGPGRFVPWALAVLVVLAVALGATKLLGGVGSGEASGPKPARAGTKTPKPSAPSPTSKPTADRTKSVKVLNSTNRAGLASTVAGTLKTAGWTVRGTGNYTGGSVPTTVFYGSADLAATAQALADDLGAPAEVTESADLGAKAVTVVLGQDFPG
jgi:hypothetical protein